MLEDLETTRMLISLGMQAKYTGVRTLNTSALERQRQRDQEKAASALQALDNELQDTAAFGGELEDIG